MPFWKYDFSVKTTNHGTLFQTDLHNFYYTVKGQSFKQDWPLIVRYSLQLDQDTNLPLNWALV